jgi:AcrR family transcriptional regulator
MDGKTFENLPEEKKQSILNAGMSLFGQYGYEKTSIADIAKAAGISKPAVFHYFGTKDNLFLYLVQYTHNALKDIFKEGAEDFFETMTAFIHAQLQLIKIYPGMFDFMVIVNEMAISNTFEVFQPLFEEYRALNENAVVARVNWSKFRDEYDRATAMNLASWVGTSCLMQYKDTMPIDDIFTEAKRYLEILKMALYKPEYL